MPKTLRCYCGGRPSCKLCNGTRTYQYEVGPRGYLPFACPNCGGKGIVVEPDLDAEKCPTCRGSGTVDPADPPSHGLIDILWKALFGA